MTYTVLPGTWAPVKVWTDPSTIEPEAAQQLRNIGSLHLSAAIDDTGQRDDAVQPRLLKDQVIVRADEAVTEFTPPDRCRTPDHAAANHGHQSRSREDVPHTSWTNAIEPGFPDYRQLTRWRLGRQQLGAAFLDMRVPGCPGAAVAGVR